MATSESLIPFKKIEVDTRPVPSKHSLFKQNARAWMSLVLILSDLISLLLAFLIAMNVWLGSVDPLNQYFYMDFLWVPILLMLILYVKYDLFPGIGLSSSEEVRRLTNATTLSFLILIMLTFFLKTTTFNSRIGFIMAWALSLVIIPVNRNLMRRLCTWLKIWGEPVGIVGFPDRRVVEIADFFKKYPHKGINPTAIFVDDPEKCNETEASYEIIRADEIYAMAKYFRLDTVLVVVPNWNWAGDNLDRFRYSFRRVILIRQQRDSFSLSESVALDFNGVMGTQVFHNLLNPWAMVIKRVIDITFSVLALFLLAPVAAVINLLIHFTSPGPVFYRQKRLGKDGKEFDFLKFRTMYINGDEIFQAKLKTDKKLRDEWKKYQKVKSDPRITTIGAFLRKYSLDELPQLINILRGDMSLVGPRPIMVDQRQMYGPSFHDYSQVRPGVTGLWQVSGRNNTTFARRAEYDMEYIQRWSLWMDMYIIFRTFREVVSKDGAY
jgi:Undecaprenyl-phosphate galactose phosphotransferase WbaP